LGITKGENRANGFASAARAANGERKPINNGNNDSDKTRNALFPLPLKFLFSFFVFLFI